MMDSFLAWRVSRKFFSQISSDCLIKVKSAPFYLVVGDLEDGKGFGD